MQAFTKVGLEALLTPDNCVVVMIDHQPFQLANVNSHEPTMVINNAIGLAMTARAYGIPTILTTVNEDSGGQIFKGVQDIFPDHKTINRTYINAWEDERGCRPECGWNYNRHNLRETNYSILCGEFNWLIDGLCGKALPAIDLAHVDLAGSKQCPEQHGSRVRRRQHGLRLDPALELFV
jgi:hypothetical protein